MSKKVETKFSSLLPSHGPEEAREMLIAVGRLSPASESALVAGGLPATSWTYLEGVGFSRSEIARVVDTSTKTVQRKERRAEPLGLAEGDRTMRLLRIMAQAVEAIGDWEKAMRWLRTPSTFLGGKTPLETIATEAGAALVRQSLGAVEYGGVA